MKQEILLNVTPGGTFVQGFRYLWMKRVTGFRSEHCCARCLEGEYVDGVEAGMEGLTLTIPAQEGELFYLCGVSSPYQHERNLHLALRVSPGSSALIDSYAGDRFEVFGAEGVPFDADVARKAFPEAPEGQLSCRCFQFGAQEVSRCQTEESLYGAIRRDDFESA